MQKAPEPAQPVLPGVPFDESFVDISTLPHSVSTECLEKQAKDGARQLATSMTPAAFINLALIAAMKVTDEATENSDAKALLELVDDHRPVDECSFLSGLYDRLAPHLSRQLPPPLLSTDALVGEGLHAGTQILLNPLNLKDPNLALFVMAHEAAHAEGRHTVRRAALRETGFLLNHGCEGSVLQEATWQLEFEADARAAELAVKAGIQDVRPVLKTLLESREGEEHPDGYRRALAVRDRFRALDVEVSDETWQALMLETRPSRDAHREAQKKEEEFRRALASFV